MLAAVCIDFPVISKGGKVSDKLTMLCPYNMHAMKSVLVLAHLLRTILFAYPT